MAPKGTLVYDGGNGAGGSYRTLTTAQGTYRAQYFGGGSGEQTKIRDPQMQERSFHTPGLMDFQLLALNGLLVIEYTYWEDGNPRRPVYRVDTGIAIGGGTPPVGGNASFPGAVQPDGSTVLNNVNFEGQAVSTPKVQVWDLNSAGEIWTRAWENGALGPWNRVS